MRLEKQIRRILREELLKESYIEPPKSEIDKSGVLLDLIISNIDNYKKNETKYYNALIDFKNYFKTEAFYLKFQLKNGGQIQESDKILGSL